MAFEPEGEQYGSDHPAKRRRLDDSEPLVLPSTRSTDYIVLATQSYQVNVNDTEVYKSLLKSGCNGYVEVTNVSAHAHHRIFQVRVPWLKLTTELATATNTTNPIEPDLIEICTTLSSSLKKVKHDYDQPICKYEAHLSLSTLQIRLLWHNSVYSYDKVDDQCRLLLHRYSSPSQDLATDPVHEPVPWAIKEFYDNVHVPSPQQNGKLRLDMIQCKLYPFQDRATHWMLSREGVHVLPSGRLAATPTDSTLR